MSRCGGGREKRRCLLPLDLLENRFPFPWDLLLKFSSYRLWKARPIHDGKSFTSWVSACCNNNSLSGNKVVIWKTSIMHLCNSLCKVWISQSWTWKGRKISFMGFLCFIRRALQGLAKSLHKVLDTSYPPAASGSTENNKVPVTCCHSLASNMSETAYF